MSTFEEWWAEDDNDEVYSPLVKAKAKAAWDAATEAANNRYTVIDLSDKYTIVPLEPTQKMLEMGAQDVDDHNGNFNFRRVYKAMIAATQ